MLPKEATLAALEEEMPGIQAYATRRGWSVEWNPETLRLIFLGKHPCDNTPMRVVAAVDGYRALPPAWTFAPPEGQPVGGSFFPQGGSPPAMSSIFHQCHKVICAHFNRLAYSDHGGPHGDWRGPANWLEQKGKGHVYAERLADMFAVILVHLRASKGMST